MPPLDHPIDRLDHPESNAAGIHLLSAGSSGFGIRFRTIGPKWKCFPPPFEIGAIFAKQAEAAPPGAGPAGRRTRRGAPNPPRGVAPVGAPNPPPGAETAA